MKHYLFSSLGALLAALAPAHRAAAQDAPALNHTALYVHELAKSVAFYRDVLRLPVLPEPFRDGRHAWFRTGPHSQLHLIEGAAKVEEHDKNSHLAFRVKNLRSFLTHLDAAHVRYGSWQGQARQTTPRPDGVKQVYLQDPDNFWIELNDDGF